MSMPRGLRKATEYYNKVEAWNEWKRFDKLARDDGVNLDWLRSIAPDVNASTTKIWKAVNKIRPILTQRGDDGETQ